MDMAVDTINEYEYDKIKEHIKNSEVLFKENEMQEFGKKKIKSNWKTIPFRPCIWVTFEKTCLVLFSNATKTKISF